MTNEQLDALVIALRNGEQADMDGTFVKVSRQACEEAADALTALRARAEAAEADAERLADGDFMRLVAGGIAEAERAMVKFPQPNYVISKVAEEAGEVVKAAIHCAEGRESPAAAIGEMRQLIAMIYRLWREGDQVHGLKPLAAHNERMK